MKTFNQLITEVLDDSTDHPTETTATGTKVWRDENGLIHRDGDKPAVVRLTYGGKEWYKHGKLHRLNGPAIVYSDTDPAHWFYYINGKQYSQDEYEELIKKFGSDNVEAAIDALDI